MRCVDINRMSYSRFTVTFSVAGGGGGVSGFAQGRHADVLRLRRSRYSQARQPATHACSAQEASRQPGRTPGRKGAPDEWAVQFYGSVLHHEGKFKMWYVAADDESLELIKRGLGFSGLRPAYAESEDGVHWRKPNLGLVEHRGSRQNNLVLMDPPDVGGIHLIVIHEADEPDPARRFKMLLTVAATLGKSKGSTSITLFSPDGLRWKSGTRVRFEKGFLVEEDLILPPENFEQGGLYRWNGMYHLPGQQFSPWVWQPDGKPVGRAMTILRSRDLVQWEPTKTLSFIRGGAIGREIPVGQAEEAHLAASVWHRGNVLLGVYGLWHGAANWQDRTIDLGFMISNDGLHFREPVQDFVFIPRGEEGAGIKGGFSRDKASPTWATKRITGMGVGTCKSRAIRHAAAWEW